MGDVAHHQSYWRALYAVAHDLVSTLEPADVLNRLARSAAEALNVRACTLRLLAPDGRTLNASAHYGLSEGYLRKGGVDVEHSPVDREALQGKSVSLRDVRHDPRFQYPEQAATEGLVSLLCVPLIAHGRAIGVMRVYTGDERTFDAEEIEFLDAIASLGAVSIENARLYQRLAQDLDTTMDVLWGDNGSPPGSVAVRQE